MMFGAKFDGARSTCAVLVRTYTRLAQMRLPNRKDAKSRTNKVVPQTSSETSGELPKKKGERKELPFLRPVSRLSSHQAHAMVLYQDGETETHLAACNTITSRCFVYCCASEVEPFQ